METNAAEIVVYSRATSRSWVRTLIEGIGSEIDMPAFGITLPLAEIYDGVAFAVRPHLVKVDDAQGSPQPPIGKNPR